MHDKVTSLYNKFRAKSSIAFSVLLAIFISCNQQNTGENQQNSTLKTEFESVEISFDKKSKGITSIYIDSTKTIRIRLSDTIHSVQYLTGQIPDSKLSELNRLTSEAIGKTIDSICQYPSDVTISYSLILKQNNKTLQTFVYEDKDYPLRELSDLSRYLFSLKHMGKENKSDTDFIFKTYHIISNPPIPEKDTVKFIPPVIKYE